MITTGCSRSNERLFAGREGFTSLQREKNHNIIKCFQTLSNIFKHSHTRPCTFSHTKSCLFCLEIRILEHLDSPSVELISTQLILWNLILFSSWCWLIPTLEANEWLLLSKIADPIISLTTLPWVGSSAISQVKTIQVKTACFTLWAFYLALGNQSWICWLSRQHATAV